ncbi:hypothetical protein BO70DRAFT_430579 [Aspergillus heteromorphus CBS 117.55]|uniref:Zn(2)-C6 fungal-type domain-containing protein n=1 Tax=Aspergillus heteromorphus CBS 117.55 TaxID=1448321 RepID=A0A317VRW7_9EURO|nr:uncharacterized protein BO70DRAFT_430579 [Aspergillus heteromorphus CBS 117.55]PWY77063.1 hypothetical protein BO70DRAFT_430579 [Aspergillus heteromorphus CBS 117.55]
MEIDPRLRAGGDDGPADASDYHLSSPASRLPDPSAAPSASAPTTTTTPTPSSSHFSPADHLRSSASGPSYFRPSAPQSQSQSHSQSIYPEPDPALGTTARQDSVDVDPNDPYAELRRPRACEACRQLKVRCEPDLTHPNGTCKRCAKAGRNCVVTLPTRKRQKKTDSRVAELERKIDALTASLQASHGQESLPSLGTLNPPREEPIARRWLGPTTHASVNVSAPVPLKSPSCSTAGSKRRHSGEVKESVPASSGTSSPSEGQALYTKAIKQWRAMGYGTDQGPKEGENSEDVIDRGLVSASLAAEAFTRYTEHMATLIPLVVFPPGTTMNDVRQKKPVLFHAIIACAIGTIQPELQIPLLNDFYKIIAERIVVKGEKSLDLVQAVIVCCNWYSPPDNFEEVKFNQLAHIAVTVAMDLGLYRKMIPKVKPFSLVKELISKKSSIVLDLDSVEARRTWLACYFLAVQVAVSLRRVNLVRWLPYMDECVDILEKSPDALPSDKALIQWAKLTQIIEETSVQFNSDEAPSISSFSDPKFLYTLKVLEKQLEQWKRETPPDLYSSIMKQAHCIVDLFLHENAMHVDFNKVDPKSAKDDLTSPLSAAHINALSSCLSAIHDALDVLCSIDPKELVNAPTIALARTSFAVVALIKIYSIVSTPDTRMGQVMEPASLKTEYYLDKVIRHYTKAGELPGGRTAAKFSVVLTMLRNWFMKRKDQGPALKDALSIYKETCDERIQRSRHGPQHRSGQQQSHQQQQQQQQSLTTTTSTPLTTSHPPPTPRNSNPSRNNIINNNPLRPLPHPQPTTTPPTNPPDPSTTTTTSNTEPWVPYPRQFYPPAPFTTPTYQDLPAFSDPDPSANGLVLPDGPIQGFFVPELGVQMGFDPENLLALGNMLGDGILNLPFQADGGMGFY